MELNEKACLKITSELQLGLIFEGILRVPVENG
jgi:hypothetical protein